MIVYSQKIYVRNVFKAGFLEIENNKIKRFYDETEYKFVPDLDCSEYMILPGIFDTHNHGGFGVRVDIANEEEIRLYLKGLASVGVTEIFPTTSNYEAMDKIAKIVKEGYEGAKIMGIHSEGPWGARVGEKGVNTGYPTVDLDYAKKMVEASAGLLKLVDIAPEIENAKAAIDYFLAKGITMGMYHTNANYAQACKGIDWGISVVTHLCNVMTGLHHRDVGVLGCGLLRDELDCELICDGLHVCNDMLRLVLKIKDNDRLMMVSDNVQYCAAPPGRYLGLNASADSDRKYINVTEEGFVLSDTGRLSGSSKPVIYGVKNLNKNLGIPLENIIPMYSVNPNRKYGFLDHKGTLDNGKDADFIVVDHDFNVLYTYVEGKKVYDRKIDGMIFDEGFLGKYLIKE